MYTSTKSTPRKKQKNILHKKTADLLLEYCKDINGWPKSWRIEHVDIKFGEELLNEFKSFLIEKIEQGRAKNTIKIYARYLWVLGGEIISQINTDDYDRKLMPRDVLLNSLDESGGPYWPGAFDELQHRRYDSICRLLYKFMTRKSD